MPETDVDVHNADEQRQSEWVRLQSSDGFSYLVKRKVAEASGTIRNMLDSTGGYAEAQSRICDIRERGIVVEKLVEYMSFKTHYESVGSKEEIPVNDFIERIPPEIVLELLLAADYQEMYFMNCNFSGLVIPSVSQPERRKPDTEAR